MEKGITFIHFFSLFVPLLKTMLMRTQLLILFLLHAVFLQAQTPKLMLPIGHTEQVKFSRISPDNKRVVTVGSDSKVIMWDLLTGLRLAELKSENKSLEDLQFNKKQSRILGIQWYDSKKSVPLWDYATGNLLANLEHKADVKYAEFSPDGEKVVTASWDGTVTIWNAATGTAQHTLSASRVMVLKASFSHDSKKAVTAGSDQLAVWNVAAGQQLLLLEGHTDMINDAVFSPDNSKVASISKDKTAKLWNAENGALLFTLPLDGDGDKIYFNATGDAVVTLTSGIGYKGIKLWSTATGKLLQTLVNKTDEARFAVFSHKGSLVAAGSENSNDVTVFEVATGKLLYTLKDHYGGGRDAAFSPDDRFLTVASSSGDARTWDLTTGGAYLKMPGTLNGFTDVEISSDGKTTVLTGGDAAQVWHTGRKTLAMQLHDQSETVEKIILHREKRLLITDNRNQSATKVWDAAKGQVLCTDMYEPGVERIVFSATYAFALRRMKDEQRYEVWNIEKNKKQATLDPQQARYLNRWVFTPDDKKLITADIDNTIKLWDVETGKLLQALPGAHAATIDQIHCSKDGKWFLTLDQESYKGVIWDAETGTALRTLPKLHNSFIREAAFLPGTGWLITSGSSDKLAKLWDIKSGKLLLTINGHKGALREFHMSPDHSLLLTAAFNDAEARLWDLKNMRLLKTLGGHSDEVKTIRPTKDWRYFVSLATFEGAIRVWNGKTGVLLQTLDGHKNTTYELIFGDDDKTVFSRGIDNTTKKWDLETGRLVFTLPVSSFTFSYNKATGELLTGTFDGKVQLWDAESGTLKRSFEGHTNTILATAFGFQNDQVISSSGDNTLKIWDKTTGKPVTTFFSIGSGYFNQVSTGYYQSTSGAARLLHYVMPDLKVVTFEQLDVKYNRPDLVLQALNNPDTALVQSYRRAYEKRVRKLGIDTASFSDGFGLPEADFVNREEIRFEQSGNVLRLRIKGRDSAFYLDRFNVWVNEAPVFGLKGVSLKNRRANILDTTLQVLLSNGTNIIETSVTNVNGTESFRMPLTVSHQPSEAQPGKVHFIGIGIDRFLDNRQNLNYSVKDIRDLAEKLREKFGEALVMDTLFNEEVTVSNVIALRAKLLNTTVNDKVILSYSGHGLLSRQYDYFLSTYGVDFKNPEANGLPYESLEGLLDSIPARKKLVLIDACHSGEVDKEEAQQYRRVLSEKSGEGLRGGGVENTDITQRVGMKNSFELMQQLFVNVGRSTGATVISAAGGLQLAQEGGGRQNGVFTYSILEFLKKQRSATVSELKEYVNKRVPELTNGLQQPTTRTETKQADWQVW